MLVFLFAKNIIGPGIEPWSTPSILVAILKTPPYGIALKFLRFLVFSWEHYQMLFNLVKLQSGLSAN